MYFLRYKEIKEQLVNREVSDRIALPYLVGDSILICLFMYPELIFGKTHDPNVWDVVSLGVHVSLVFFGILYAYHKNEGRHGFDFLYKYFMLGWVLSCRFVIVVYLTPYLVLLVIRDLAWHDFTWANYETSPIDVVYIAIVLLAYFYKLGKHISDIAVPRIEIVNP